VVNLEIFLIVHICVNNLLLIFSKNRLRDVMPCAQGRNEGGRGAQFPGANSLWGLCITAGGAENSQQCHKYFLQYSKFVFERTQVRPRGRQTYFCPGRHLTSLRPCMCSKLPLIFRSGQFTSKSCLVFLQFYFFHPPLDILTSIRCICIYGTILFEKKFNAYSEGKIHNLLRS